jgi:hypothetical protein
MIGYIINKVKIYKGDIYMSFAKINNTMKFIPETDEKIQIALIAKSIASYIQNTDSQNTIVLPMANFKLGVRKAMTWQGKEIQREDINNNIFKLLFSGNEKEEEFFLKTINQDEEYVYPHYFLYENLQLFLQSLSQTRSQGHKSPLIFFSETDKE